MPKTVTITVISTVVSDKKHYVRGWGHGLGDQLIINGYTDKVDEARECFDIEDAEKIIARFRNHHGRQFTPETITVPVTPRHNYEA